MSHVAEGVCRVHDLDLLEKSLDPRLEMVRNRKTYKWYGRFLNDWHDANRAAALKGANTATFGKCEHVIRRKDGVGYEIGVKSAEDGNGYRLEYDAYGSGGHAVEEIAGKDCEKIADRYNSQVAMRRLIREGYRVREKVNAETGEIQVIATKG